MQVNTKAVGLNDNGSNFYSRNTSFISLLQDPRAIVAKAFRGFPQPI